MVIKRFYVLTITTASGFRFFRKWRQSVTIANDRLCRIAGNLSSGLKVFLSQHGVTVKRRLRSEF